MAWGRGRSHRRLRNRGTEPLITPGVIEVGARQCKATVRPNATPSDNATGRIVIILMLLMLASRRWAVCNDASIWYSRCRVRCNVPNTCPSTHLQRRQPLE